MLVLEAHGQIIHDMESPDESRWTQLACLPPSFKKEPDEMTSFLPGTALFPFSLGNMAVLITILNLSVPTTAAQVDTGTGVELMMGIAAGGSTFDSPFVESGKDLAATIDGWILYPVSSRLAIVTEFSSSRWFPSGCTFPGDSMPAHNLGIDQAGWDITIRTEGNALDFKIGPMVRIGSSGPFHLSAGILGGIRRLREDWEITYRSYHSWYILEDAPKFHSEIQAISDIRLRLGLGADVYTPALEVACSRSWRIRSGASREPMYSLDGVNIRMNLPIPELQVPSDQSGFRQKQIGRYALAGSCGGFICATFVSSLTSILNRNELTSDNLARFAAHL